MPRVVDKEAIKLEIMEAFARLSDERPLTAISLREIAAEAGMSHTKVLRYFENKNSLHVATVHWASSFICESLEQWFSSHKLSDYADKKDYLDSFFTDFQTQEQQGVNPRDVVMTCALGAYSPEIKSAIREEYARIDEIIDSGISEQFGRTLKKEELSAVSMAFLGIYFAKFNGAISNSSVCRPAGSFNSLTSG